MKKLTLLLTGLLFTFQALGITPTDLQSVPLQTQLLNNGGFENATAKWVKSIGTFTSQSGTVFAGKSAASWALSAQTGTLSQDVTSPGAINAEASCMVKTTSPNFQLCSRGAGVAGQCSTVPSDGNWNYVPVNFISPSSGTVGLQIGTSAAATGTVYVDSCYLGRASNLAQVSQAQMLGTAIWPSTTNCGWVITQTNYSSDYSPNISCPAPTVTGRLVAPSSQVPQVIVNNLTAGAYVVHATFTGNNTITALKKFRIVDDLGNVFTDSGDSEGSGVVVRTTIAGTFTYTTAQATRTFKIQSASASGSSGFYLDGSNGIDLEIYVEYFPSQAQTAVGVAQTLSVLAADFYTPAATCPAGSVKEDGTAYVLSAHPELTALANALPSSYTVAGILTVPNKLGIYTSGAGTQTLGGIVYTNTLGAYSNDQLQGHSHADGFAGVNTSSAFGTVTTVSTGNINSQAGSSVNNHALTSGPVYTDGTNGTPRVGATTNPANFAETPCISYASQPAPVLVGSITSGSAGALRIEYAQVSTSSTGSIVSSSSSWISYNSGATGYAALDIHGFSAVPVCTATVFNGSDAKQYAAFSVMLQNQIVVYTISQASSTPVANSVNIICMGPK